VPNEIGFDIFRGLQGLAAAAMAPTALGILGVTFPPGKAKDVAFGCFGAGAPLGGVIGNIFVSGPLDRRRVSLIERRVVLLASISVGNGSTGLSGSSLRFAQSQATSSFHCHRLNSNRVCVIPWIGWVELSSLLDSSCWYLRFQKAMLLAGARHGYHL
jgi:MFS family permease